ncbi:MAG: CoxG family protein [Jhaorihella sp.]
MQMSDTREIKADPAAVFAALLDPEVLKACVSGAQEVTGNPEDGYEATVIQKVGPVKATFKGQVTMSDMVQDRSLTITGEGKGGAAGFAKGEAQVTLEPTEAGGTILAYEVEARVGGKLAQLGSRLIDGFAKKMADQFFARLQEVLEGPPEASSAEDDAASEPDAQEPKKSWLKKLTRRD